MREREEVRSQARPVITAEAVRSRQAQDAARSADILSAPLFGALLDDFARHERFVVLDLGQAQPATLALFGQVRCRLEVADLAEGLDMLNAQTEEAELQAAVESLLPSRGEPIDLVLCWDLMNYLSRPAFMTVMDCIAERARPGALAHLLVVYSASRMPVRPSRYVPEERKLRRVVVSPEERPAPRYSPEDLSHCLRRYRAERGKLLMNGMQEFLYRVDA